MNKTKVTTRKGSKSKTQKESPQVFVLPPNLLEKLGIHLGNYGSAPESTKGSQVTDSNLITKDNGSRENKLACKKDTDSSVTATSEIESSIIETAELMKKSVFLSPTFISNHTSVIQGEIEIVGNVETEDIEISASILNNDNSPKALEELSTDTHQGHIPIPNVETPSSNLTFASTEESIHCDQLVYGNVEMNNVQMQTLLDDHADEAYSSDCSNSNMGCTAKTELKYNQNKINIISEQIILPSQFYELKSNYSPKDSSLIPVSLNTMINQNNNQVNIHESDLNMDSIRNVANIVQTEITVVNECDIDMHRQHFVERDTNISIEDDEILQNINKIDLCSVLKETDSEFIITTQNQETSQQDLEEFQNLNENHMITKDDPAMDRCMIVSRLIDGDNGNNLINNSSDGAVKEAFKIYNTDSYFDKINDEKMMFETMSNESKTYILVDSNKKSSSPYITEDEKKSKMTSSHMEANLKTEDIIDDRYTNKEVVRTKKEFDSSEINNTEQPSVLQNGEIDSIDNENTHSLKVNKETNSSLLKNLSENACKRRTGANTNIGKANPSRDALEKKNNKNNPAQQLPTSPIFYVKRYKKSIRENNDLVNDEGKQEIENNEAQELKKSGTDSLESKELNLTHINKGTVIQEDKVREIAKYLSEFADMKKRHHFLNIQKTVNSKTLSKKKDSTSSKLSSEGVEKPGGSGINKQGKTPVKTYGRRCIQRRKTVPSFVFKDSNKSTEFIDLTDSSSFNNFCHDMEVCLCYDFGRLKSYDDVISYEHIHFWNNTKTDCTAEIICEDASAVSVDNELMNVLEEYPSLTSHETLYKLCWHEFKGIGDDDLDGSDAGEESKPVKTEKNILACSDDDMEKKKCNENQEPEKEVAPQNNTMINVNSLQTCEGIPNNKIVADVHSAKTGQKRKRSIVSSDDGEPPAKNSKRRISKRLSQTKDGHTYIYEKQIATNSVKKTSSQVTPGEESVEHGLKKETPDNTGLVKCGVCGEFMQDIEWNDHRASRHDYLSWQCGEPPLDVNNEAVVREHLYEIAKACGGLTCFKCGLTRKYVKLYLSHIRTCTGLSESQNDSPYDVSSEVIPEVETADVTVNETGGQDKASTTTGLITCGVCQESVELKDWNHHIASRHDYLAWKDGDEPLDVNDEVAVREHLYEITKACGGLMCVKCGITRKYVKAYLSHSKRCDGLHESQKDSTYNVSVDEGKLSALVIGLLSNTEIVKEEANTTTALVKCAVCEESMQEKNWNDHISARHHYLAWKLGDAALDVNDETAVRDHLYQITKACGGLTCAKCGLTRKYVRAYLSHVKNCSGLSNLEDGSQNLVLETQASMNEEHKLTTADGNPMLVKCGVCGQYTANNGWMQHIAANHGYMAWKDGQPPLNANDEKEVRLHLRSIIKQVEILSCQKCDVPHKTVKSYLYHINHCGNNQDNVIPEPDPNPLQESQDDSAVDFSSGGTCAVCHKEIEPNKWIQHTQKEHNYLAWREGEKSWNLDDFEDINQYLYIICKKMDGLTCNKCGIVRKYVKTFMTHIKNCDVTDFNRDSSIAEGVGPLNKEVVQCAMCTEQIKRSDWKDHAMKKHYNITWIIGETPIDIKNPYAVERYLKEYKKVYGRLKCNICNASRASFTGFYAHIIVCGKTEEEVDMYKTVCEICNSKYLCIYKNQHAMIHRVQDYSAELKTKKAGNNSELNTEPNLLGKRRAAVKARSVIENYSDNMSKHAYSCRSCGFGTDFEDELKTHKCDVSNEKDFSGDESSAAEMGSSEDESGDTDVDSNISNEVNDTVDYDDDEDGGELQVKKKRHRERAPVPSKVSRIPFEVENPTSYIRKGDDDFCNTYLTDEVLFPQWQCAGKWQLEAVPDFEMIRYLPPLEQSCEVKYCSGWKTLKKFETKKDENGISLFVGASIICIAWAPVRVEDIREGSTNFLAVACHNGPDCPRYQGDETPTHENLIQIWNFSKFERLPELVLGIAHDFGTVWSMDWCPSGARDALSDGEVTRRLGLLAVACSSGSAYIFAVPYPSKAVKNTQFVYKMKPVAELRMTMGSERKRYQATSVSWSKQKGHSLVLVGYADGSTAYYDLHSTSPLLLTVENDVQVFHPYNDERPHNTCITGTGLYPVSTDAAGAGAGVWTAPTGAELAARAGAGAVGRARLSTAVQAVVFAPHACCAVLGGDGVIMHTAISELAWVPPGRRLGGIRTMAGCGRCGRVVASTPPILRILRPHPAFCDVKKQVVGLLEMVHLAKKIKKQVSDELGMVLEPLTYNEAIIKYGISFKKIGRTDRVKQNECSAKPKAHCPERFPLADVKSMAFCPSRRHHERLALATHAGILFLININ